MIIFALDSTETVAAAAISDDETLIAAAVINGKLTHSETLLELTRSLFYCARLDISDVSLFACSAGPGSFTGVRIGVSHIKGLAFGRGMPCVGVSATEALAWNFLGWRGLVCVGMDARRSQLYNALYYADGVTVRRLTEDRVISADELNGELLSLPKELTSDGIRLCGGGYAIMRERISSDAVIDTPEPMRRQNGYPVTQLALREYRAGRTVNDITLVPVYLRPSQAERSLTENKQ